MRWGRKQLVFAVILVVASLAPGGVAEAKKPARVVSATAPGSATANNGVATATATCPGNTRAVGGGFKLTPPVFGGPGTALGLPYESQMVGQNAWRVSAQLSSAGTAAIFLTTTVYCRRGAPTTTTASGTASVPVGGSGGVAHGTCKGGRKAVAGGFAMPLPASNPGGTSIIADSFRANPSIWEARAVTGIPAGSTVTSFAYCAKLTKKHKAPVQATGSSPTTAAEPTTVSSTATAPCRAKTKPLDGGFSTPGTTGGGLTGFDYFIYESLAAGKGWQSSGLFVPAGGTFTGTLNSFAYCG